MRPNPPRMITVVVAVALTVLGLLLFFAPDLSGQAADLIGELGLPRDIESLVLGWLREELVPYLALAFSPVLLIAGSLLKGL